MNKPAHSGYGSFLEGLKEKIISARVSAYQSVNRHLVDLYLLIGQGIYEKVETAKWGEGVIETLAADLKEAFPDMKGFSSQNLWRMKQMHEAYRGNSILSTLLRELSWSHNVLILQHTKTTEEREFYLKTATKEHWSYRELDRQIDSGLFERFMLSKETKGLVTPQKTLTKRLISRMNMPLISWD